jgi:hypothetical protein
MSEISRASVSWCGIMSENFVASNWEKQGGVSSPVLFCIFINDMLSALSTADVDCLLGHIFIEALAYADDIARTDGATAMRTLLATCDDFAGEYKIAFSAAKSESLALFPKSRQFCCNICVITRSISMVNSSVFLNPTFTFDI